MNLPALDSPEPVCCKQIMHRDYVIPGTEGFNTFLFSCRKCEKHVTIRVEVIVEKPCYSCGKHRCGRDHLGDEGGYLP